MHYVHKVIKNWCYWGSMGFVLIAPGRAVAIEGLNISKLERKTPISESNLKEPVEVNLFPKDNQDYNVDTDVEDELETIGSSREVAQLRKAVAGKGFSQVSQVLNPRKNRSRHRPDKQDSGYDYTKNYVKKEEKAIPTPSSLAKDAKRIQEAESNCMTRESTTILCVALRDNHGHIKRFVFYNGEGVMGPSYRVKAEKLGYDVIQGKKAHAEGQFILFLHDRSLCRPGLYTHIIAMGCSRKHCSGCNWLFKTILGPNYSSVTAAVAVDREASKSSVQEVSEDSNTLKFTRIEETTCKVAEGKQALDRGKENEEVLNAYKDELPSELKKLTRIDKSKDPNISQSETRKRQRQ